MTLVVIEYLNWRIIMPSCSTAENPSGQTITFIEDTHEYFSIVNGTKITYTSGTTWLHHFFEEFDPSGEITRRCALKEGISVEELKAKWKAKGNEACRFGTRTHEICEDIELNREIRNTPENEKEVKVFANAKKIAKQFYNSIDILGVEKIVFSVPLRISGTIDLFGRSRKTGDYLIIDHKTNKTIDTENKYNKFALNPIQHIPDLNFYHYALQLNLYQYLLQHEKYVPIGSKFRLFLNHITEQEAKLIELPNLQMEIRDMMISFISNKLNNR